MGFDGKTLIHPNQIEPCNAAFSPGADEVAQARKMIAAFDLPENKDKGVVQIDGRMVERCTPRWRAAPWRSRRRSRRAWLPRSRADVPFDDPARPAHSAVQAEEARAAALPASQVALP